MSYYNAISPGYDKLHLEEQIQKAKAIKEKLPIKGLLLDVGAGTGAITKLFEGQADCIALDPCLEMVKRFNGPKVVAKAEQLPFKENCFDAVISITALHHANLALAKKEIDRVAKEGAGIGISFFKRAKNFAQAKALFSRFRQVDSKKDLIFVNK